MINAETFRLRYAHVYDVRERFYIRLSNSDSRLNDLQKKTVVCLYGTLRYAILILSDSPSLRGAVASSETVERSGRMKR